MFIAVFFYNSQDMEVTEFLSIDDWIKKMW